MTSQSQDSEGRVSGYEGARSVYDRTKELLGEETSIDAGDRSLPAKTRRRINQLNELAWGNRSLDPERHDRIATARRHGSTPIRQGIQPGRSRGL